MARGVAIEGKELAAIKLAKARGPIFGQEHPEIAVLYLQNNKTVRQIATEFKSQFGEGLSYSLKCSIIHYALESLLTEEERELAARNHHALARVTSFIKGVGIHGISPKERKENSGRGGDTVFREKVGIGGFTDEERSIRGQLGAIGRGQEPMTEEEKDFLLKLCQDPAFQRTGLAWKGRPDYDKIVPAMNEKFNRHRTKAAWQIWGSKVQQEFKKKQGK